MKWRIEWWLCEAPPLSVYHVRGSLDDAKRVVSEYAAARGWTPSDDWWHDPHPAPYYSNMLQRNYATNTDDINALLGTTAYIRHI